MNMNTSDGVRYPFNFANVLFEFQNETIHKNNNKYKYGKKKIIC